MERFARQIATAQRLIKKNGQAVVWVEKPSPAGVNPQNAWHGDNVTAETRHANVMVCFVPVESKEDLAAFRFLHDTDVQVGSTFGLMGAVTFNPTANHYIVRDGETLNIRRLDYLKPNGKPVLYLVEFMR